MRNNGSEGEIVGKYGGGSYAAVWDALAQTYDQERTDPVYSAVIELTVAALRPRGRVLECGAGTGMATRRLTAASEIIATDYSGQSLTLLRERVSHVGLRVIQADVRCLPFPDEYFDCVLCANVLQHLDPVGQKAAAREILRVLRRGGRYAVSVHHYSRAKAAAGWVKEGKPGQNGVDYIFRFTRAELADLFPGARIRACGFYGFPFQAFPVAVFGRMLARLGVGHMLIASGQKGAPGR
jgi:SAM-dependent methyltransferase